MSIRPAALLVAAALVLGGGAAAAGPAAAESGVEPAPAAEIVVAPNEPALDPEEARFDFSVLIENPGDEELPTGTLTLELAANRAEDEAALTSDFPGIGAVVLAEQDIGAIGGEDARELTVSVPRDDVPLFDLDTPGVYLVRATLRFDDQPASAGSVSAVTPVVWRGSGSAPVPLAMIVPLVLPSEIHAMPNRATLDSLSPRFDALIDSALEQRATLAIDPRLIAGIRAYGDDAPPRAAALLERLETVPLPSFLLQFADADPAAQAALGLPELLEPVNLSYVTRLGSFPAVEDETNGGAQEADDAPGGAEPEGAAPEDKGVNDTGMNDTGANGAEEPAEPVPGLGRLLAWPQQQTPTGWPAEGQADQATALLLHEAGIDTLVLDSQNVDLEGGPRAAFGEDQALVTDAQLGASTQQALSATTLAEQRAGIANAAAQLALAAQTGSDGLLLGLDRGAVGNSESPAGVIDQLAALDWVIPVAVAGLPEGTAVLREQEEPDAERLESLSAALENEPDVNRMSALLRNPDYLTGYQRDRLLEFFATRHADSGFSAKAERYRERDEELESGVYTIGTENIQLVGTSTQLPVQLRNALPFDAVVNVRVTPASAALSVTEREFEEVEVQGDGNASIMVPVRSRISSGESALDISVTDAAGELTVSTDKLPITIRANFEQIALWTLAGIASLLLVFGIIRSLRRRRARRDTAPGDGHTDAGE